MNNTSTTSDRIFKFQRTLLCAGSYLGGQYQLSDQPAEPGDVIEKTYFNKKKGEYVFLCFLDEAHNEQILLNVHSPERTFGDGEPTYYMVHGTPADITAGFKIPGQPEITYYDIGYRTDTEVQKFQNSRNLIKRFYGRILKFVKTNHSKQRAPDLIIKNHPSDNQLSPAPNIDKHKAFIASKNHH